MPSSSAQRNPSISGDRGRPVNTIVVDTGAILNDNAQNPSHGVSQGPQRALTKDEESWDRISNERMAHLKTDRHMSIWDVIALNLNSMIGTGIFTTPGLVLALTRSKIMTLTLWFAGAIYALLG